MTEQEHHRMTANLLEQLLQAGALGKWLRGVFKCKRTIEQANEVSISLVNAQESSITTESEEVIKQRMDSLVAKK